MMMPTKTSATATTPASVWEGENGNNGLSIFIALGGVELTRSRQVSGNI
jgi:hypothetical protein